MELFRVRLNCVDHYQSPPTRFDPRLQCGDAPLQGYGGAASRGYGDTLEVPVIRVYGSTETGQKVCAHIHGVFPYLYIEYSGSLSPDIGRYCLSLVTSWS
jgi:DNA polymerase zeta